MCFTRTSGVSPGTGTHVPVLCSIASAGASFGTGTIAGNETRYVPITYSSWSIPSGSASGMDSIWSSFTAAPPRPVQGNRREGSFGR
jgi:hypothetical protein